jgi:hypothetical protein
MDSFDLAVSQASEQGSEVWHNIRAGRFTSSELHRLIKSGTRPMTKQELDGRPKSGPGSAAKMTEDPTKFSPDGISYIEEKVAEVLTGQVEEQAFSYATAWGNDWEPIAAEFYAERFKCEFEIIAFQPYGDHAGGSPDRKIKGKNKGLEIKCPHRSKNQVNYLQMFDQNDLKTWYPDYYWQCQSNLLFMGWDAIDFCTYDPRMIDDKHKLFVMEVTPNAKDQDLLIVKLEAAIKEKMEILRTI